MRFDLGKTLWLWGMLLPDVLVSLSVVTAPLVALLVLAFATLCLGHSVGLHRGIIHRTSRLGSPTSSGGAVFASCVEVASDRRGLSLAVFAGGPWAAMVNRASASGRSVGHHVSKAAICTDGFTLLQGAAPAHLVDSLLASIEGMATDAWQRRRGARYAVRNIHLHVDELSCLLADAGIPTLARSVLGSPATLVFATLFDKVAGANWTVPPHQDLALPVSQRADMPGFGPWSKRSGVDQVVVPDQVLTQSVALRVHLDDCPTEGGALEVASGTHRQRMKQTEIAALPAAAYRRCPAHRGDILAMRPLAVHKSRSSKVPGHRRVLHTLYSTADLPPPLDWISSRSHGAAG